MKAAVFPGTFNPPTLGHLDIIERATHLFDRVYIAVTIDNPGYFTAQERIGLLKQATSDYPNVVVEPFSGLLVDYAIKREIDCILRAIRDTADADFERRLAQMNRQLAQIETLCLVTAPEFAHLSSTLVREIGAGGRRLHGLVPECIEEMVFNRLVK